METFTFNSSAKGTWRLMRPTKNTNKKASVLHSKSNQCKFKPKLLGSSYPTHFKQFFSLSRMQINVLNKAHSLSMTQKIPSSSGFHSEASHTQKTKLCDHNLPEQSYSQISFAESTNLPSYPLLKQIVTETNIKLLKARLQNHQNAPNQQSLRSQQLKAQQITLGGDWRGWDELVTDPLCRSHATHTEERLATWTGNWKSISSATWPHQFWPKATEKCIPRLKYVSISVLENSYPNYFFYFESPCKKYRFSIQTLSNFCACSCNPDPAPVASKDQPKQRSESDSNLNPSGYESATAVASRLSGPGTLPTSAHGSSTGTAADLPVLLRVPFGRSVGTCWWQILPSFLSTGKYVWTALHSTSTGWQILPFFQPDLSATPRSVQLTLLKYLSQQSYTYPFS